MSDSKNSLGLLGWASAAVLVSFVASTKLAPHAFESLRPADRQGSLIVPVVDADVNARLWEDPFTAVRRYDAERPLRCEREKNGRALSADCSSRALEDRMPERLLLRLDGDGNGKVSDTLVLIGLMPGGDFAGAEEARRRIRYSTLAGLMAQGYVHDNPDRLGLLEFRDLMPPVEVAEPLPQFFQDSLKNRLFVPSANSSTLALQRLRTLGGIPNGTVFTVPYELVSPRRPAAGTADTRYSRVAVLWVDEGALPGRKFDALARLANGALGSLAHKVLEQQVRKTHLRLLQNIEPDGAHSDSASIPNGGASATTAMTPASSASQVAVAASAADRAAPASSAPQAPAALPPPEALKRPAVAVIGPSSTDALRSAIVDLRCAAERRAPAAGQLDPALCNTSVPTARDDSATAGYELLAAAVFYNSASTAPAATLAELHGQPLADFVTDQMRRVARKPELKPVQIVRTIATDDQLIDPLLAELKLRLPPDSPRRLAVVAERGNLYSQGLVEELQRRLDGAKDQTLVLDKAFFFGGLDGATPREQPTDKAQPRPATDDFVAREPEWPEGRDQRDYLRRMAEALRQSQTRPGAVPIGAIGVFVTDVHDKLAILQALHDEFPDKPFFTTDLDARFLHPKVQDYTRNLIVAGSLPLAFPAAGASSAQTLQAGTPPLRDAYQSATYLAARYAGCASEACRASEKAALDALLEHPSVYEIGRGTAVPLSGQAHSQRADEPAMGNVAAAVVMGLLIVLGVLVWPSTPSLERVREAFLHGPAGRAGGSTRLLDMNTVVLGTLQLAAMAFVVASLIEFARPDEVNFVHMLWLGSLGGFAGMLAMMPALLAPVGGGPGSKSPRGLNLVHVALVLAAVAVWTWMAWPAGRAAGTACTQCEPVTWLQGISAWPSHLLHLLAVVVAVGAFDLVWSGTSRALGEDSEWLRIPVPPAPTLRRITLLRMLRYWFLNFSVLFWRRPDGLTCGVGQLWREYAWRTHGQARALRIFCLFVLTEGLVALVFFSMSEGQVPAIPVRGAQHRLMVGATLYALLLLVPLLIVAVADATVLLLYFVRHLNAGRSAYPAETLEAFATSLGGAHRAHWLLPIAGRPEDRGPTATGPWRHTLLDAWIDVQLVARRSHRTASFVFWPFIVLALLVVARSRVFDNWALTPAVATGVSLYVAMLVALTLLLKHACEQTRKRALDSMRADLRWLEGSDAPLSDLAQPFQRLITDVESNQTGAFAPFLDQPLLRSLLVPLGGAGLTQLVERLLNTR